ncbi:Protein of unknown function DUF247, partial [Theobroma cacao]
MNSFEESDVNSLFDISFTEATMKIPTFMVEDYTKCLFRNLIAYELYEEGSTYVIDYSRMCNRFVSMEFSKILGNDGAIGQGDTFYYEEIFVDLKRHCARRWNTWKAKLKQDYFNSPWASVSFSAAFL